MRPRSIETIEKLESEEFDLYTIQKNADTLSKMGLKR